MATKTEISWTDSTVNFWHGCKKVSDGCKFCYMYRDKERYGQDPTTIIRGSDKIFYQALRWQEGRKIFTCSWSDFFIEEADAWRAEAWKVIKATPQHMWQILTKRPERVLQCLPDDWGDGYPNVWLGVTVESDKAASQRIPLMQHWKAAVRFVSFEPLLTPINLFAVLREAGNIAIPFEWAIIGGESGNNNGKYRFRHCHIEWIEDLAQDLGLANVAVWVKQLGTGWAQYMRFKDRHGADKSEWPKHIQIQQFPPSPGGSEIRGEKIEPR